MPELACQKLSSSDAPSNVVCHRLFIGAHQLVASLRGIHVAVPLTAQFNSSRQEPPVDFNRCEGRALVVAGIYARAAIEVTSDRARYRWVHSLVSAVITRTGICLRSIRLFASE